LAIDPTSGDINSDGVFDAADYTVWQDNGGDQIITEPGKIILENLSPVVQGQTMSPNPPLCS